MIPNLRLGLYVAACVALAGLGLWIVSLKHKADRVDAAEARMAQLAADYAQRLRQLESERNAAQEASDSYAEELAALRATRAPPRVVRVCPDTRAHVPAAPGPAAGADAPNAGTGVLPEVAGSDIGPGLSAKAAEADELIAQCRALQSWVASTR